MCSSSNEVNGALFKPGKGILSGTRQFSHNTYISPARTITATETYTQETKEVAQQNPIYASIITPIAN
jgi:hypothetical protein